MLLLDIINLDCWRSIMPEVTEVKQSLKIEVEGLAWNMLKKFFEEDTDYKNVKAASVSTKVINARLLERRLNIESKKVGMLFKNA